MVFSKINGEIEYIESRKIDAEDKGHQSSAYDAKLFEKGINWSWLKKLPFINKSKS